MPDEAKKQNNSQTLAYLKRGEVRTMAKDLSQLREKEAREEREKVAELEITQEQEGEKARLEQARTEAEERQKTDEEAEGKEGELIILKERQEQREAEMKIGEAQKEEFKRREIGEQLRKTQQREEGERRRFLERVTAEAEGKETLVPRPMTPPAPPVELPLAIPYTPLKPSLIEKLWVRIALGIFILMNIIMLATFWYWYFMVREKPAPGVPAAPAAPTAPSQEIVVPPLVINERILDWGYIVPDVPRAINAIVVHSVYNALGGDPYGIEGIIQEYELYGVAAHYLVDKEGIIYQTAPDQAIAYHAGVSRMPDGRTNVNDFSIGIELIYTKDEAPTDKQYQSLAGLIKYIQKRNGISIPDENILGHKDIAPDRKTDPWNFDWGKLVEK